MKNTGGEEGEVFRLCIAHVGALCRQRLGYTKDVDKNLNKYFGGK